MTLFTSPLALLLLATAAGLLAFAFWWFKPILQAVAADLEAQRPAPTKPTPAGLLDPDCGIGATLMAAAAQGGGGAGTKPRRKKPTGPGRREFLRKSWLASMGGVVGAFSLASIGFLWPRLGSGFGGIIGFGSEEDILAAIDEGGGRAERPEGKLYFVRYDASQDEEGIYESLNGGARVMAIYQRCVHLGCRVPWCETSKWFECPCHGSRYNRWGEYEFGPAPRGLDRFPIELRDGNVFVDTRPQENGPSRTGGTLGEPAAGPNCNG